MTRHGYRALRRIGARSPMNSDYRGTFALIGYRGRKKPKFVAQVNDGFYFPET